MANVLGKAGHEVAIESDPVCGFATLSAAPPDLLILDLMFPEDPSAGFKIARQVRGSPGLKALPILMVTAVTHKFPLGFSSKDIDNEWFPVDDFLEKPVDLEFLVEKVNQILYLR